MNLSLREICEDLLAVPVIQSELGGGIAGATVQIGEDRAIVLNLDGDNRHAFVRRATVAHELGHLLYDPPPRLNALRVDGYDDLDRFPHQLRDPVEQRANAFGVELIAPKAAAVDTYNASTGDGVWDVMNHFGISFTAARYQIWNGLERTIELDELQTRPGHRPDPMWETSEAYTIDYHPLRGVRFSRAGRFSGVVAKAAEEGLVSWDTAAEMLEVEPAVLKATVPAIKDLFPGVF